MVRYLFVLMGFSIWLLLLKIRDFLEVSNGVSLKVYWLGIGISFLGCLLLLWVFKLFPDF